MIVVVVTVVVVIVVAVSVIVDFWITDLSVFEYHVINVYLSRVPAHSSS